MIAYITNPDWKTTFLIGIGISIGSTTLKLYLLPAFTDYMSNGLIATLEEIVFPLLSFAGGILILIALLHGLYNLVFKRTNS